MAGALSSLSPEHLTASVSHPVQQEGHRLAGLISPELGFNIHTLQLSVKVISPRFQQGAPHLHGEAVYYYLSGSGWQTVGDLIFVPAAAPHALANPGDDPLCLLVAEQLPETYLQFPTLWRDPA